MKKKIFLVILGTSFTIFSPTLLLAGNEYSATSFNLIGPNGRVTAQITSSVEGTPAIFFYDENNKVRLNLGIYPGGAPGVILMDKDGNAAAILRLTDDGHTPVLVMKEGGVDKKIIGLGQYDEKKIEINSDGNTAAKIETVSVRTTTEKRHEYLLYVLAFGLGLIGAYIGGRIATRPKRILDILIQNNNVREKVASELLAQKEESEKREATWRIEIANEERKKVVEESIAKAQIERDSRILATIEAARVVAQQREQVVIASERANEAQKIKTVNTFQKETKIADSYAGSLLQKDTLFGEIKTSEVKVRKITHGAYTIDTGKEKGDELS